jgi:polysaccharide export outer membrane protein
MKPGVKMKRMLLFLITTIMFLFLSSNVFAKDYIIGGGDSLQISVWGSPELSIETIVRPDGKISLPALGEIKASGLTAMQLTKVLEKEMAKIVKTPIVTVVVTGMTNYRIFVFGRGAPAGVHSLSKKTTLLEFLCQLGPLENADLENAYLVRDKKKIKSGFYELFEKGDFSQDILLEPDDMLFIPDNFEKRISIVGAVNNPTTVTYREGLTIMDIILSAGGFTEFAKKNDVKILRKKEDGNRIEITVRAKELMKGNMDENIIMKPGDFVIVKESMF